MKGKCVCNLDGCGSLALAPEAVAVGTPLPAVYLCPQPGQEQVSESWPVAHLTGERCYLSVSICISHTYKNSSSWLACLRLLVCTCGKCPWRFSPCFLRGLYRLEKLDLGDRGAQKVPQVVTSVLTFLLERFCSFWESNLFMDFRCSSENFPTSKVLMKFTGAGF